MAVERMRSRDNIGDLAKELRATRRRLYEWQSKLDHLEPGEEAPRTNSHESSHRQQVHRLKRLLAEKILEVGFFKGALQEIEAYSSPRMDLVIPHPILAARACRQRISTSRS